MRKVESKKVPSKPRHRKRFTSSCMEIFLKDPQDLITFSGLLQRFIGQICSSSCHNSIFNSMFPSTGNAVNSIWNTQETMAVTRSMHVTYDPVLQWSHAPPIWTTVATETCSCSYSEEWRHHESGQPMEVELFQRHLNPCLVKVLYNLWNTIYRNTWVLWSSLNEMFVPRLRHLNAWFQLLVVWKGSGSVSLTASVEI